MTTADRSHPLYTALGRIPSGMFVLTAGQGPDETGMLTSWVQQCSFDPPQISLAVKAGRGIQRLLTPGAVFTLNVLDDSQTDMIAHFGRGFAPGEPAFDGIELERPSGLPPVLQEAHAYLACEVVGSFPAGDHDLLLARVVDGRRLNDGEPMTHVRKSGTHY